MFAYGNVLIDREPDEVYRALADLRIQMPCWEIIYVPNLENLEDGTLEVSGTYTLGHSSILCDIELHLTRPSSGLVTRIQWATGELAAEWRIIEDGDRTRVEVSIEGRGGGLANNVSLRQITPKILARLKQHFDRA